MLQTSFPQLSFQLNHDFKVLIEEEVRRRSQTETMNA
jgi:hypothetical protein